MLFVAPLTKDNYVFFYLDAEPHFCLWGVLSSHRRAGGFLDNGDVHLADVGIEAAQLLKHTAAVHAWKQRLSFTL